MKKYRIGFNLDTPVRLLGMTKDEIAIILFGFMMLIISSQKIIGLALLIGSLFAVVSIKRLKRKSSGFRLKSFLFWHLGMKGKSFTFPPSHTRNLK